jgi:methionyl-tRNA formyltransferase
MKEPSLIYLGGRKRGSQCLKIILQKGIKVSHVFCLKEDLHESIYFEKVEEVAGKNKIPFTVYTPSMASYLLQEASRIKPTTILAVGWRNMISEEVLSKSRYGGFLIHDSLLPRFRGSAPSTWSVINGETKGGVTLFKISSKVDAGAIVGQQSFAIEPEDYISSVFDKVDEACAKLIKKYLKEILSGKAKLKLQNEKKATYCCLRTPEDGDVQWLWSTQQIYNWIRALSRPNPGAFSYYNGKRIYFWKAHPQRKPHPYEGRIPGCVVGRHPEKGIEVLTGDGSIFITELQAEGDVPRPSCDVIKEFKARFVHR